MKDSEPICREEGSTLVSPIIAFLAAVQFLTIVPPIIRRPFTPKELGASVAFYPLVGFFLGGLLFSADYWMAYWLAPQVRSALILALWVVFSGALHLDGFLDSCDGLLGGHSTESRLEIMRDERVGAYALAGGITLFLIKFSALAGITDRLGALVLTPILGRWGMSLALLAFPYARPEGLGRAIKDHTTWPGFLLATVTALLVSWFAGGWIGLLALGVTALVVFCGGAFTLRKIPGLTGDVYGALNELVEMTVLLTFAVAQEL